MLPTLTIWDQKNDNQEEEDTNTISQLEKHHIGLQQPNFYNTEAYYSSQ